MADRKLIVHPGVKFACAVEAATAFLAYDPPRLAGDAGRLVFGGKVYVYRTPNGTVVVRPAQPVEHGRG